MLAYVKHIAQPTSHQPVPDEETSTTPPDPELPPESRFSGSSQGALPWQRDEEAVDSSSVVGASLLSSSGISNRKKKPAALRWLQLSSASRGNQTLGNWSDPLEPLGSEFPSGSELVPFDQTDLGLYEFDTSLAMDEPSTASPTKVNATERQPSLRRSDPPGVAQTLFSEHVETLGSECSVPHTHLRLIPETDATRPHIPTPTVSQTNGQAGEETSFTTQKWEALQPAPSLLMLPVSSLLFIQPTASVPILQHSSSVSSAEETFVRQAVAQFSYANTSPPPFPHKTSNKSTFPLQIHPQVELLGPESGLSGVLWPSSVSPFLAHAGQRRGTGALPDQLHPPDFTSPTAAGPWVVERTPTLLHVNSDRMLPAGSHHPPNLLAVSTGSLPVATVIPEQMAAAAAVLSSLLSPHPVVQTPSSGSHDRRPSILTFNRDLSGLQQTVPLLHADSQVNRSSASSGDGAQDGPSAALTPSVMAATQMLGLSSNKPPQRASGLDDSAYPSPADREHLGHVTHADTLSSQKLNVSRRSGPDAEAGAGTSRPPHLPEGLSPSRSPAPSLPVTPTPSSPSPLVSLDVTASPPPFSSRLTPSLSLLLSAQLTLLAASANVDRSGISRPSHGGSTTFPVLESVHRLLPSHRPDEILQSTRSPPVSVNQSDPDLLRFATSSQTANTSGLSSGAEAAVAGRQSDLFDPAHVVPKIHVGVELEASAAASAGDDVTLDADLFPVEPLRPTSEPSYHQTTAAPVPPSALHTSGLNIPSSPTGAPAEAPGQGFISGSEELPRPASAAGFKHISTSSLITLKDAETTNTTKTVSAPVTSAPGQMEAPQGSGTGGEPAAGLDVDAHTSAVNETVSKLPSNSGPSAGASGLKDAHRVTATDSSSSPTAPPKAVSTSAGGADNPKEAAPRPVPGSPTVGLIARPPLPCQCKQRFHFTCLCGLSSGNSMSRSNTPVDVENLNQSAACTVKNGPNSWY